MQYYASFFFIFSAATFFCTYELTKYFLCDQLPEQYTPLIHMLAASLGEVVSEIKGGS